MKNSTETAAGAEAQAEAVGVKRHEKPVASMTPEERQAFLAARREKVNE